MEEAVKLEAELGDFTNQLAETYQTAANQGKKDVKAVFKGLIKNIVSHFANKIDDEIFEWKPKGKVNPLAARLGVGLNLAINKPVAAPIVVIEEKKAPEPEKKKSWWDALTGDDKPKEPEWQLSEKSKAMLTPRSLQKVMTFSKDQRTLLFTPKGSLNSQFLLRRGGGKFGVLTPKIDNTKQVALPVQGVTTVAPKEQPNELRDNMRELINDYFTSVGEILVQVNADLKQAEIDCNACRNAVKGDQDNSAAAIQSTKIKFKS